MFVQYDTVLYNNYPRLVNPCKTISVPGAVPEFIGNVLQSASEGIDDLQTSELAQHLGKGP